jgi:hypothetical protein
MLVAATLLAVSFLWPDARHSWVNYWLLQDSQQGLAVVTDEYWGGHDVVDYKYIVNQKEYTGRSPRNWENEKYRNVQVGGESVVYFSASHPWLSLLHKPTRVVEVWPITLLILLVEFLFVMTIVNPKGKWAMNIKV